MAQLMASRSRHEAVERRRVGVFVFGGKMAGFLGQEECAYKKSTRVLNEFSVCLVLQFVTP